MRKERGRRGKRKICNFCVDKIDYIDYKATSKLAKYITERGKIIPGASQELCQTPAPVNSGLDARNIALLPYTAE